jgi:Uma2 family endonuclease
MIKALHLKEDPSMATITSPTTKTLTESRTPTVADLLAQFDEVLARRILLKPTPGTATVDDVVAINEREDRICELVNGVLVEKTMGFYESNLACVLIQILRNFLDQYRLGVVAGEQGMIRLAPDLVRIPDVSFVSRDQFPDGRVGREPVPFLSPTLAVEVLSPSNSKAEMEQKLRDYFAAGSKLVWYLDPADRSVRVYTSPDHFTRLDESQTLDGGDVLPGFSLPIREWFERAEQPFAGG